MLQVIEYIIPVVTYGTTTDSNGLVTETKYIRMFVTFCIYFVAFFLSFICDIFKYLFTSSLRYIARL